MVGSAVAMMVWSSAPRNIASMMPSTLVLISGCVSARGSGSASGFAARGFDSGSCLAARGFGFGFAEVMTRGWEILIAGNPLNALPVSTKQDVLTRGWYVQGTNTRHSGVDAPRKRGIQYAMTGKATMNVSGSWIIRFRE